MTVRSECGLSFSCLNIYFGGLVIPITEYSVQLLGINVPV